LCHQHEVTGMSKTWIMTAMSVAALAGPAAQAEPDPSGCPQQVVDAIA